MARIAEAPRGLTWWHIYGLSWLGAIGFTMSLFRGRRARVEPWTRQLNVARTTASAAG